MSTKLLPFAAILGALAACQDARTSPSSATAPEPAPAQSLETIAARRASLRNAFQAAATRDARRAVRREAAAFLERALIDTVLPRWNGTPWAFSGTSTTPGAGSIACGYFVSTTLGEAGLRVERSKLAQQPSEDIIKTLVPPGAIARFSDVPVETFVAAVAARGDGLYVVGLDIHVGFLVVKGGDVLFHHSSYVEPRQVVREKAQRSAPLVQSRYRVIGKLFTDDALIDAWLLDTPIATKTRARP